VAVIGNRWSPSANRSESPSCSILPQEQIHHRRADEGRHEEVVGLVVQGLRRPCCWRTPSRITAIRVPIVIASTWSCVTYIVI
jgi:hypothetical protein